MAVQDYKINYKSDFVLTINGDAGWAVPFCIKFWTGMPSQAYFVGFDGVKYVNCRVGDTPTQLLVMFDDHHLPIGPLRMQIAYHTTIEEFPGSVFDEVTNARDVIVTIDGTDYQVLLDFTGEDAPELEFDLPAYANEAERIQNELQRQQNEADRIAAELQREQASAAAVQGAENVNAQLNGTTLTVTNRNGVSTSVNTKGEQGEQGPVGPQGETGETGPRGTSIVSFTPKSTTATTLIYTVTFSDGTTQDVAIPKGAKGDTGATGPQGPQGDTGVSITAFTYASETETDMIYTVTFSDSTTQQVAIPKGEKGDTGEQGPVGPQGPQGPMGDVAVITPEQQAAFTMYSTTGQNTNGPMTQKAVTDNLVASAISYDNSQSGLASDNVQSAVDELAQNGDLYEDCLANCIHEASSTEITTTISNTNLVNKNASWSISSNGRLILIASALIDVTGANKVRLAVNSSAVASGSNIVQYTLPMYDSSKTYILSLDLGWKAIGTVPYIEIDLTSSTYANVAYVGLYLGASSAKTQIYNTDVNPSGITYTLYMPAFYTTKAVDEAGLEDYINNYDVLSNCHHSTGGGVVTEGVESTSFMNGLQNWTASQTRITLIKGELIDVSHIVSVTVTIPYSAVSSDTNIDRCQIPFYSTNKTYLGSLDPGWTYFNGNNVTITYDLTSPNYANVGYLGCYFGSNNVNISPSSIDASGIVFALTQEAEYTTKAVDELMLEDFAQTAGVRTMANYTGEKVVITPKYDYKEVFNMPAASQNRQGAAIYGNYLFQCFNTNAYVQVWNVSNKSLVQTINLSEDASNHAAGASFGKFYDSTDPFPLLYIAAFNSNYIYVYRITGTVGSLTMSLIQTITIDSSLMYLPNMVIDKENMKMILYGYNINSYSQPANNYLKFAVLDVPPTDSDLTITQSELDRQFTIPYRFACQDAVAYYGKMLMFWGYAGNVQGSGFIQVDYTNGLLVSDANTNTMLDNTDEVQGVGIWNGGIITTSYLGSVRLLEF